MPLPIAVGAFLIGCTLCWLASSQVAAELAFQRGAIAAQGHVIALIPRTSTGSRAGTVYVPQFQFTDPQGRVIDAMIAEGSSPPSWSIGETASLLYNETATPRLQVDSLFGRWREEMLLAAVAAAFLAPMFIVATQRVRQRA